MRVGQGDDDVRLPPSSGQALLGLAAYDCRFAFVARGGDGCDVAHAVSP